MNRYERALKLFDAREEVEFQSTFTPDVARTCIDRGFAPYKRGMERVIENNPGAIQTELEGIRARGTLRHPAGIAAQFQINNLVRPFEELAYEHYARRENPLFFALYYDVSWAVRMSVQGILQADRELTGLGSAMNIEAKRIKEEYIDDPEGVGEQIFDQDARQGVELLQYLERDPSGLTIIDLFKDRVDEKDQLAIRPIQVPEFVQAGIQFARDIQGRLVPIAQQLPPLK